MRRFFKEQKSCWAVIHLNRVGRCARVRRIRRNVRGLLKSTAFGVESGGWGRAGVRQKKPARRFVRIREILKSARNLPLRGVVQVDPEDQVDDLRVLAGVILRKRVRAIVKSIPRNVAVLVPVAARAANSVDRVDVIHRNRVGQFVSKTQKPVVDLDQDPAGKVVLQVGSLATQQSVKG